jgi:hypothetical protein
MKEERARIKYKKAVINREEEYEGGKSENPKLREIKIKKKIVHVYLFTYLLTYGAEPLLRSRQLGSHSRTSQRFMEPEGSSPCSQEPSTGPYPEPDRPSPHHPILSQIYFNTVHPPTSKKIHAY